jgi:hypothetical protein
MHDHIGSLASRRPELADSSGQFRHKNAYDFRFSHDVNQDFTKSQFCPNERLKNPEALMSSNQTKIRKSRFVCTVHRALL